MPKRKRVGEGSDGHKAQNSEDVDTNRPIVGGLKDPTLKSRISGDEPQSSDEVQTFKVPYKDKFIVCEGRPSASKTPTTSLLFTHGAGGGIANPATRDFAVGFAQAARIVTFQGTMNLKSRVSTFHTMLEHEGRVSALGGRSMGARAAVIAATESSSDIKSLVLVSYPLIGGKTNSDRRDQILYDLPKEVDVLFVVGDNDGQCPLDMLETVREKMDGQKTWLMKVEGADHGMSLKRKALIKDLREKTGELAARWVVDRSAVPETCVLACNESDQFVLVESDPGGRDDNDNGRKKPAAKKRRRHG